MIKKSFTEAAARALSLWVGTADRRGARPSRRRQARGSRRPRADADARSSRRTSPTWARNAPTSRVQTYGGHGFIRENGVEQFVRDAHISKLYEGTNGIQALDLIGHKLPMKGG